MSRTPLLVALLAACSFPPPPDIDPPNNPGVPDDAQHDGPIDSPPIDSPPDAPDVPGTVLQVAPTGDDANDGLALPVKTLKRAIGLAAANPQITKIALAGGRYSTATGETFPYTIPANLAVVGPAGGGAILVGSKAEPGLSIGAATLQDVELEDFTVAITATGTAQVTNTRIRASALAIRVETTSKLTVNNLDITGTAGACATGIVLNGASELSVSILATRGLGVTLEANDQSAATLNEANVSSDASCKTNAMLIRTGSSFTLTSGLLDGGFDGIAFTPRSGALHAMITNTVLRSFQNKALVGGSARGVSMAVEMSGGSVTDNKNGGGDLLYGSWKFVGVTISKNPPFGLYAQEATLVMRDCVLTENGSGINLLSPASADLGTSLNPGNNTLRNNTFVGLYYDSSSIQVEAVGNVWNPSKQGSDSSGRYSNAAVLQGPIPLTNGNNYYMACDPGQCFLHR